MKNAWRVIIRSMGEAASGEATASCQGGQTTLLDFGQGKQQIDHSRQDMPGDCGMHETCANTPRD